MGVYQLEHFIKNFVKGGFIEVSLALEIEDFKKQNVSTKPILIFDVMAFVSLLSKNKSEILCGGRFQKCYEILDSSFTRLQALEAELVFFLDGCIQDTKFSTWARRQDKKYEKNLKIMNEVYQGTPLKMIIQKHGLDIYTNTLLSAIEVVCEKHGQLNYAVKRECDQEIAHFAYNNQRVLAVFSNDTDFLIFPGNWRYFSVQDLNLNTLKTKEFDRKALRKALKLNRYQMKIFATISGNDIIQHHELRRFHENFAFTAKMKFPDIAKYVKKNFYDFNHHFEMLHFVSKEIFGQVNDYTLKRLQSSFQSYCVNVDDASDDESVNPHLLHQHCIFTYNILNASPINFSLVFFDLRQNDIVHYHNLAIPLFQRQAGVVLLQSSAPNTKLTVYTKVSHYGNYNKISLPAIFPPFEVPLLEELFGDDPYFDENRFELLKWTIDYEKLQDFDLKLIPRNYLIDILTLVFMIRKSIITQKEADIFLWTIKNVENKSIPSETKAPAVLDPHAFRLAFLYVRLFANISRSIEVCGLKKIYGKPLNFDGVFFHNEYLRYKNEDFDTYEMLNTL